ncbi:MAG: dihydrolipoamide acetyltransferase family protein [Planctomycetota bacterium]
MTEYESNMATAIKIPDLGTTTDEVKLVEWLKQEGDPVKRGEALCEVETDKATDELESVAEGVLLRQVVPAGSEIVSGTIIAYVGSPGELIPEPGTAAPAQAEKSDGQEGLPKDDVAPGVSPVIRNLAKGRGVDLDSVTGTGPGGRITREDVIRTKQAGGDRVARLSKDQLAVARRVSRSNREIPAIDLTCTVDMSGAMRLRRRVIQETSQKVAYDSIFVFAVAQAITASCNFMSHVTEEEVVIHDSTDIAVAISSQRRLYTPVIRNADELSLSEIELELQRLVEKTRRGELRAEDLVGGSFTVSNLGMFPVRSFNVIIPPGQSAALAVGAIEERPVVKEGRILPLPVVNVVLSVDHRLINGTEAAEFLKQLKEFLETL